MRNPFKFRLLQRPKDDGQTLTLTVGEKFKAATLAVDMSIRDVVTQLRRLADWAEQQIP